MKLCRFPTPSHRHDAGALRLWLAFRADNTAFASHCFFSYAEPFRPLVGPNREPPSSPAIVVQHAHAPRLFDGLIWPKTGCASIV
jgi:hypothetical protein